MPGLQPRRPLGEVGVTGLWGLDEARQLYLPHCRDKDREGPGC